MNISAISSIAFQRRTPKASSKEAISTPYNVEDYEKMRADFKSASYIAYNAIEDKKRLVESLEQNGYTSFDDPETGCKVSCTKSVYDKNPRDISLTNSQGTQERVYDFTLGDKELAKYDHYYIELKDEQGKPFVVDTQFGEIEKIIPDFTLTQLHQKIQPPFYFSVDSEDNDFMYAVRGCFGKKQYKFYSDIPY